jgi:hypothetical protein
MGRLPKLKNGTKRFGKTEILSFERFDFDFFATSSGDLSAGKRFVAVEGENCYADKDGLKAGVGLVPFTPFNKNLPSLAGLTVKEIFSLPVLESENVYSERLGVMAEYGALYYCTSADTAFTRVVIFGGDMKPIVAMDGDGKTYPLFANGMLFYQTPKKVETLINSNVAPIACVYKNRVFCVIEPFTIAYSAALAPCDFSDSIDDSGRISFPSEKGKIVGLLPFEESLFVFYEYGVSRLSLAGRAREFTMEKLEYDGGKILQNSMGACGVDGAKVFFLASDGAYVFDGKKARKICKNLAINPLQNDCVCRCAESLGKYFLTFQDDMGMQKTLVVDGETEIGYYAFDLAGLSKVSGKAVCQLGDTLVEVVDGGVLPSGWACGFRALDVRFGKGVKTLKSVTFYGEGQVDVTIKCNGKAVKKRLFFEKGVAKMPVRLRGETFDFILALEKNTIIRRLDVELGVCDFKG